MKTSFLFAECLVASAVVATAADDGVSAASPDTAPSPPQCAAQALQAAIDTTPDGGVVTLPPGKVYLENPLTIEGRTNLTVRGSADTIVILHYSPWDEPVWTISPRFFVKRSSGIALEGFRVTTDNLVNASGRVVAKNPDDGTYEAEIDPQFPITGWEHIYGSDTFDEDGMPDYAIETYDTWNVRKETLPDGKGGERTKTIGLAYEVVGPQRIRVKAPSSAALSRLRIGHRILYRYTIYGHSVFNIDASRDTVLRDIEIERCPSFGVAVSPLSENVALERFSIRPPAGDHALYTANADGIHVLGLAGRFVMHDCHFRGLGDDALNIHGKAGEITSFDPNTGSLSAICRNPHGKETDLPHGWARPGDTLAVYDATTLLVKARLHVKSWSDDGNAVVAPIGNGARQDPAPPSVGDFLGNERDFPAVDIENCSVENTRARGLLLQSRHMRVRNCLFRGISLPGIIIAPDFTTWFEAGPSEDVEIAGCTFEKCGMNGAPANLGAITVKTSHDNSLGNHPAGVHRDIRILGNTFRGCGAGGIFIASASGIEVRDNIFENGWRNPPENADPDRRDVRLHNCEP